MDFKSGGQAAGMTFVGNSPNIQVCDLSGVTMFKSCVPHFDVFAGKHLW